MRHSLCFLLASAVAGSFISTVAGSVHALSCEAPGILAPAWDSIDVPTNTLIWCTDREGSLDLQVTDADGRSVSGTRTVLTSPHYSTLVFRPDTELAPHALYSFQCEMYGSAASFTTGAGPRNDPPAPPSLEGMQVLAQADTGWGSSVLAWFHNISTQDTVVVLDLEGGATLDTGALTGSLDDLDFMNVPEGSTFVGNAPCVANWPEARLGASTRLRFGAFDLTGAFSGWTDWKTVTLPDAFEGDEGKQVEPVTRIEPPGAAPDELPGNDVDEQTIHGNGAPSNEVVHADLTSDRVVTPSRQGTGCQLGARSGGSWAAGLLAALACIVARRRRAAPPRMSPPR